MSLLVISPYRWGRYPSRHYELTRALASRVPVVHLTVSVSAEVRTPTVRLVGEDGPTLIEWILDRVTGSLLHRGPRAFAERLAQRQVRPVLERSGRAPTMAWSWITEPWVRALVPGPVVVDLIDPPLDGNFASAQRMITRLVRSGVALSCTAEALVDDVRAAGGEAEVIPNGWSGALSRSPATGTPFTCGYVGTIDERFDHDLVLAVARALPDIRFLIVGRVNHDQRDRFAPLAALGNVTAPGPVPYESTVDFSVGLIPFRRGPVGDRINPVKMYEYLAMGVEVLATDIRECRAVPLVRCAASADAWVEQIRAVHVGRRIPNEQREAFLASSSWGTRAEQVLDRLARINTSVAGRRR